MEEGKKLTPKQERFCEEYLVDLNATKAAIRSGYSEQTAYAIGHENLSKPEIQNRISLVQKELSERTKITAEIWLNELAKVGFSDLRNYYSSDTEGIQITQLNRQFTGAIKEFKTTTIEGENYTSTTKEFKLHDKLAALEKIGKHLGFFEVDNKQKNDGKVLAVEFVGKKDKDADK